MIYPIDVPHIRDRVLEYVGPCHARQLRLVSHDWNNSAVGALAASSNFLVRVTPENIDDNASSRLLRDNVDPYKSKLKIALDFGSATTRTQFQHLIDIASNKFCAVSVDGEDPQERRESVDKITFRGADDLFVVGLPDWNDLLQLLRRVAPGLRSLDLFDRSWLVADRTFLHQQHYHASTLSFPALEELAYCWQEPTMFLLDALLQPGVAPQLTRLQITVRDAASSPFFPLKLRASLKSLQHMPRLTDLTLGLDLVASGFLVSSSVELRTVRRLCLHILKNQDGAGAGGTGLFGAFIGRMFPEVKALDLRYEQVVVGPELQSWLWFPWNLGPLLNLESLGYEWLADYADGGSGAATPTALLKVKGSEMSNSFPALRFVSTDLGFKLSNAEVKAENSAAGQRLKFVTVQRLQLRLLVASTLTGVELHRYAASLHELYPHVTCLVFDLEGSNPNSCVRSIEIVAREFHGLAELEILGCDSQVGEILQELTAETGEGAGEALRLVRRLKIKLGRSVLEANRMTTSNLCSLAKTLHGIRRGGRGAPEGQGSRAASGAEEKCNL